MFLDFLNLYFATTARDVLRHKPPQDTTMSARIASDIIDCLTRGAARKRIPQNEWVALCGIARQMARVVSYGATPEDWQQLAGYAEWAVKPQVMSGKPGDLSLEPLAVHGQWIEWRGGACPVADAVCVEVRFRNGKSELSGLRAGVYSWKHYGEATDIIAYRIVD